MSVTNKVAGRRVYNIASIPGDGIGVEVIEQTIRVLRKLEEILQAFSLHFEHIDWSSEPYKTLGEYIPRGGLEILKRYDAILFGAVGSPGMCLGNRGCGVSLNSD
jgi:isocitrate/isopropylmalate dehydrogenase